MDIYVFGLGHVGLPMACWIALIDKHVYGIDIDDNTIENIKNGTIEIEEYYHETHLKDIACMLTENGQLSVSTSLTRVNPDPSVFFVSVGIADLPDGSKDLTPVMSVIEEISKILVPDDLIILRSTMIPGTCERILIPKLQLLGIPFSLAYCPETIIETKAFDELENNPMILAGMDEDSYQKAEKFLRSISDQEIYRASNIRTAEMAKVVQNLHRDVDIALSNEMSDVASYLNINSEELQSLTNVNPRVSMLTSGPGVGGYCLPNALSYLQNAATGMHLSLSQTARMLNQKRPSKIVEIASDALKAEGKSLTGASIAITGLAMKNYCADLRFSPALDIIKELEAMGAKIKAYDPLIPKQFAFQVDSLEECLQDADCLIIAAKQTDLYYDSECIVSRMSSPAIVIDTQHTLKHLKGATLYKI